jgi:hypothetical protein
MAARKRPQARDAKGRFIKRPKPPPLDPALVKRLGHGRRAVDYADRGEWQAVIYRELRQEEA